MSALITLRYEGKTYEVRDKYATYGEGAALHHWTDGNFGCDCNKSLFIQDQCDQDFPEMGCSEDIELVSLVYIHEEQDE